MFISKIEISNYRLFGTDTLFTIDGFNVPDGLTPGSGINVFVGENGAGKTTLLDAISLPLLEYKSDGFSLDDMNDPQQQTTINVLSNSAFSVKGTIYQLPHRYSYPHIRLFLSNSCQAQKMLRSWFFSDLISPSRWQRGNCHICQQTKQII